MAGGIYDIAEPGASATLKKEACAKRAVGIDLGTTHSLVAVVRDAPSAPQGSRARAPVCLADDEGRTLLPSAVRYRGAEPPVVGYAALASAVDYPRDTIVSAKRFMGRGPRDEETTRRFSPYEFVADGGPVVRFRVAGDRAEAGVTPIEVSAEILKTLRRRAEAALDGPVEAAVITVPAYFDDAQRQATKDAGRLAGLEVLRLLNEPTAAALAYGLDKRSEGLFAVYDLGGGTFDISILKLTGGVFEVKSTGGDTALGGDDFDRALGELLKERRQLPESELADPGRRRALLDEARRIKHQLTMEERTGEVTRSEFEQAIAPIVRRTAAPCRRALKDAGIEKGQLDGVILVGGATRTPAVRAFVRELFDKEPLADIDPDEVVALGAAVQADLLGGARRDDVLLLDVIPLSLGLEMMGGVVEKIIHRNSTIPAGARQTFTTYANAQTGFDLHVVQGERETVAECRSLARFQLTGIPPMPAGMARLEVTFMVDADGILCVAAREETTGKEAQIEVKPSYGLTDEDIERMLLESYEHAEGDVKARLFVEARVEAERIQVALGEALGADGRLLSKDERAEIDRRLAALAEAAAGVDHRLIRECTEALDLASKPFAERRMNEGIARAIGGRKVGEVEKRVEHARGTEHHGRH